MLYAEFDADQSGMLDFEEFEKMINGLRLQRQLVMDDNIWRLFDNFQPAPTEDWEAQAAWFGLQMDIGEGLSHAARGRGRPGGDAEGFKAALRRLAREIDRRQRAAAAGRKDGGVTGQGVEEAQLVRAVCGVSGARLSEESVAEGLAALRSAARARGAAGESAAAEAAVKAGADWAVRYRQLEEEMMHRYSVACPRLTRFALRVRRARAAAGAAAAGGGTALWAAGSVKPLSAMSRREFMDYSVALSALPRQVVAAGDVRRPRTTLRISVANLWDLTMPVFERDLWGALPCRPVVQVNFQEERGRSWCPLATSDAWFLDQVNALAKLPY